jgi:hypothetical protein
VSRAASFPAELVEGHKGVTVVIVPFDPEQQWRQKPVRLDPRRDGWLVEGRVNGVPFEGYVGQRWGRFFIIVDPPLREATGVAVGDVLSIVVKPTQKASALARARALSKVTTAPKRGRPDAIDLDGGPPRRAKAR